MPDTDPLLSSAERAAIDELIRSTSPAQRILFVDPDPLVRRTSTRVLGRHFDIKAVGSANEALSMLELHTYAVIITASGLPDGDGSSLLQTVAGRWPRMRRVLLGRTTAAKPEHASDVSVARESGFTGIFDAINRSRDES